MLNSEGIEEVAGDIIEHARELLADAELMRELISNGDSTMRYAAAMRRRAEHIAELSETVRKAAWVAGRDG